MSDIYGKNTDTHSEYLILISFPRQQWLRECTSMSRSYVHCLSCISKYKLRLTDIFIGLLYSKTPRISYTSIPIVQTEHIQVLLTALRSEYYNC